MVLVSPRFPATFSRLSGPSQPPALPPAPWCFLVFFFRPKNTCFFSVFSGAVLFLPSRDIMMVASRPVRLQATPIPHLTDAILRRQLVYQTAEAEASRVQTPHGCLCPRDKHQNDDRAANRTRVASATTRSTNLYTTQSLLFITRRHCQFMLLPSDTSVVCHLCAPKKMCYRG